MTQIVNNIIYNPNLLGFQKDAVANIIFHSNTAQGSCSIDCRPIYHILNVIFTFHSLVFFVLSVEVQTHNLQNNLQKQRMRNHHQPWVVCTAAGRMYPLLRCPSKTRLPGDLKSHRERWKKEDLKRQYP